MGLDEALGAVRVAASVFRGARADEVYSRWQEFNIALGALVSAAMDHGANVDRDLAHEAVAAMEAG